MSKSKTSKVANKVVWQRLPVGAKATNVPGQRPFKAFKKIAPTKAARAGEVIDVPATARVEPTSEVVFNLIAPGTSKADRDRIIAFFKRHAKPGRVTKFRLHPATKAGAK